MSTTTALVGLIIAMSLIVMLLYIAFGQITVRRLRKNIETKNHLGLELASGWDILNVAAALARPKWLTKKFERSNLSGLAANSEVLRNNTTVFDRALAKFFWYSYILTGVFMLVVLVLNMFGVFT